MNIDKTLQTLEALVSGCSPLTGELIDSDSVLNERDVIRALQIAINELKKTSGGNIINIDEAEIKKVIHLFQQNSSNPSANKLGSFFLGTRKFRNENIVSHNLFGKYASIYEQGQLLDFFNNYLTTNYHYNNSKVNNLPWKHIDFFQGTVLNKLSLNGIEQLKNKILELGLIKSENLSPSLIERRAKHFRHSEPWGAKELELLETAIKYTNDLKLLSECFGRSENSLEFNGQKIIFNGRKANA